MRVLIGPSDRPVGSAIRAEAPDAEHEFLAFGKGAEIAWDPTRDDFDDILARLPAGWMPDITVFCSPEYHPMPKGIEHAPFPTAAIIGDWNLGGRVMHAAGPMFDILASDRNGCDRLRAAGFENVVHVRFFCHDPSMLRYMPEVERNIDVLMVGNFHGEIQRDRAPWVARIAALSQKHRVVLTTGVYGEDYNRLMNRAKIVFNRSIRGEINMRVYEAAACGALGFYERGNTEIDEVFRDGQEIVLYGPDDVEDLIDHYLSHDVQRQQIADAARALLPEHTPALKTVDVVRRLMVALPRADSGQRRARFAAGRPKSLAASSRAEQWVLCADNRMLPRAARELAESMNDGADLFAAAANLGATLAIWHGRLSPAPNESVLVADARGQLQQAVDLRARHIPSLLNLAWLERCTGRSESARQLWARCIDILRSGELEPEDLHGPVAPRAFSAQEVDTEWTCANHSPGSDSWVREMIRLHLWRAEEGLQQLAFEEGRFVDALHHATHIVKWAPERGVACILLARSHRALGHVEQAVSAYQDAIGLSPLEMEWRIELCRLLEDVGQTDGAAQVVAEALRIIDGAPCLEQYRGMLHASPSVAPIRRAPGVTALVAFPDWHDDSSWQSLLLSYARAFTAADPVSLRLRVRPDRDPAPHELGARIITLLGCEMALTPDELPDIDLVAKDLPPEDTWKLFLSADMLVSLPGSAENIYAETRSIPVLTPDRMCRAAVLHARDLTPRSESIPCPSI